MCLGIPGQVVRMLEGYGGQLALVDVVGEHRKVNVGMLPEKTDKAGADEAMAGLELMGRGSEASRANQLASRDEDSP